MSKHNNTIAVLDFGGQYAHLIANRIRHLGVHSVIKPSSAKADELRNIAGIILSGGPKSVNQENAVLADPEIFKLGIPILGICYGHQVISKVLGGTIEPGKTKEYGHTVITIEKPHGIFKGITEKTVSVWSSHWDEVTALPKGFEMLASSKDSPLVAIADLSRNIYGIQFHAEVSHTPIGNRIFQNFIELTRAEKTWDTSHYLPKIREQITRDVAASQKKVFMLVSGGVDSMVAFTLLNTTIGEEKVVGMLVDTGFMRKGEIEEISGELNKLGYHNLHVYKASEEFFSALEKVVDPEIKRQIIGKKFIEIQARAIRELELDADEWLLGQGTIYPDTIESGASEHADKIKTHHNRVPEIMEMIEKGLVIEPLADLYKDEVRELGEQIGLSHHVVWRHPFPGPGLAIRCLCSASGEPEDASYRHEEEKIQQFLQKSPWKAQVLPIRSVGVQGDLRTYRHPLLLFGKIEWNQQELQELSTRLTNTFGSINRVLLSLTGENPTEFKLLPQKYLSKERIELLREADKVVMDEIERFDLEERIIWQCPTILIPLANDGERESIVIRPFSSLNVMTANFALIPQQNLEHIVRKLSRLPVSGIWYDITNKPPGTIEWE